MTPKIVDETRKYFETEIAFWQAKANEIARAQAAATEELTKSSQARFQSAMEAQSALTASLVQHGLEAAERGAKLLASAFSPPSF